MEYPELRPQHHVSLRPRGQAASRPRVEPTAGHAHTSAEDRHTMLGLLRRDEGKPHRLCFAKNAVAFFRMSRSSSAIRSALRSRTNSSRSAVVRPVRPFERSACSRLTHSRNAVSVKSRSRAAALTVLPSSSTRRTALALNSSVNWRRARRFGVSAIGLDIVFPFGKMSTKPDQVQDRSLLSNAERFVSLISLCKYGAATVTTAVGLAANVCPAA